MAPQCKTLACIAALMLPAVMLGKLLAGDCTSAACRSGGSALLQAKANTGKAHSDAATTENFVDLEDMLNTDPDSMDVPFDASGALIEDNEEEAIENEEDDEDNEGEHDVEDDERVEDDAEDDRLVEDGGDVEWRRAGKGRKGKGKRKQQKDGEDGPEDTDPVKAKSSRTWKAGALKFNCIAEEAIRQVLASQVSEARELGPHLIRAVFHDAVDENNLLVRKKAGGGWEPLPNTTGTYGGVDGCLYSPLSKGTTGVPEPSHNRNIPSHFQVVSDWCKRLCNKNYFRGTMMCRNYEDCVVDLTVLASFAVIETFGGPRIPMTWGRRKGACSSMIETPFSKDPAKIKSYSHKPALRFAPSLTGMDDPQSFRDTFGRMGFSPTDQAALMGSHTFGKLAVCAGGMNGIEYGPWCKSPDRLDPPLNQSNFMPSSTVKPRGTCEPKFGVVSNCWLYQTADKEKGRELRLTPIYAKAEDARKGHARGFGLGDGGFFDRTPEKFDNDYFKLFAHNKFEESNNCCGGVSHGACHRKGKMMRVTQRSKNGKVLKYKLLGNGGPCGVDWCRDDNKGRTHMKSTRTWHEASHDFVKKGYHHGTTKRMIRLAADWALLSNDETRAAVQTFAEDEAAFFQAYRTAFGRVAAMGYSTDGLQTCSGSSQNAEQIEQAVNVLKCIGRIKWNSAGIQKAVDECASWPA